MRRQGEPQSQCLEIPTAPHAGCPAAGDLMDDKELQARLLYSVVVAGKSADFANNVIVRLLGICQDGELPFAMLQRKGSEIVALLQKKKPKTEFAKQRNKAQKPSLKVYAQ